MKAKIKKTQGISGEIQLPGDKSISHRALILGAIASEHTIIENCLEAEDCISTMEALKAVGADITREGNQVFIHGMAGKLKEPENIIDCGNSGTTIRLLSGLFAAQPIYTVLTGDSSLRKRPMDRIIKPLALMGAEISARGNNRYPPITIKGTTLKGINYRMPVASAQVKSCIILASLFSEGPSSIEEPFLSRDHTERMVRYFGGDIERENLVINIKGKQQLNGRYVFIPGDFSSAAYFIAAALLSEQSCLKIKNLGLNPTRTGLLDVISRMGAEVKISALKEVSGEPSGNIEITGGIKLKGIEIRPSEIPGIIDEIPLIATIASVADGRTSISGAGELKVKESDRLNAISTELEKMGARIKATDDGLEIDGVEHLQGCRVNSWKDHRIAMSLAIAALKASGTTVIEDFECVNISFPSFPELLSATGVDITLERY